MTRGMVSICRKSAVSSLFLDRRWPRQDDILMSYGRLAFLALLAIALISGGVFLVNKLVGSGFAVGGGDEDGNMSTDPAFVIIVDLPDASSSQIGMQKQIASIILKNFAERGIKPPKGMKYRVEATVSQESGPEFSMPVNGRAMAMPSMKLVCTLSIKFKDKVLSEKSLDIVSDQNTMITMVDKRPGTFIDDFQKLLWSGVLPDFEKLAKSIPKPK